MIVEKLGKLIELTKGKKHQETNDPDSKRYIQIEDLNGNENIKYTAEDGVYVQCDDIIIVWDGANAGKVGIGLTGIICSTLARMVIDKKLTFPKYLFWFLHSKFEFIKSQRTGATIPHVSNSSIQNLIIPLPPLPEQQRIATILDHADTIRRKNREILEKYNQLAQSVFFNMFSNISANKCELQEVCIINPNKSEIKSTDKSIIASFIPMANISETGEVNLSEERYLKDVWKGFTYFKEGDVLFAKITPCMENGKGAIMKNLQNEIGFGSTEFHVLRPIKDKSNSVWLYYLTSSQTFRKIAEKRMTGSAGQKRVPEKFLKEYKVNVPPYSLQNRFEVIIKTIEHQKLMAKTSLKKSEALFQSLLQRAFKGELY